MELLSIPAILTVITVFILLLAAIIVLLGGATSILNDCQYSQNEEELHEEIETLKKGAKNYVSKDKSHQIA
jgi:hypothetical protein